jgi:hypothetical protein
MIPDLIDIGSVWRALPPGLHDASLDEVELVFVTNDHRRLLFEGLASGCRALRDAGCSTAFLDGSYVTEKQDPGDFDACWDPAGVDPTLLDPVLLDFSNGRRNQKQKYRGEFVPSSARADAMRTFVDYFQVDKVSGNRKGLIVIRL